jgi:hypothetical protein
VARLIPNRVRLTTSPRAATAVASAETEAGHDL